MADKRIAIIVSAALLGAAALFAPPALRGVLVTVMVLVAPGLGIVRLVGLPAGLASVVLTVACGVAIAEVVNLVLMYLHLWSWQSVVVVVFAISLALCAIPAAPIHDPEASRP